jgi:uncharacterized protein (TIGR03435 family)
MNGRFVVLLAALSAVIATGQAAQAFEVASVKPAALGADRNWSLDPGQLTCTATIKDLLFRAYAVKNYQIDAQPWIWKDYYEILAKLPEGAQQDQIPAMLQQLLAGRFGLAVHWETKQQKVYALVIAKSGLHLKKSTQDHMGVSFTPKGHMEFKGATLAGFAGSLSNFVDRPVVNMTGAEGVFDIALDVSMEDLAGMKKLLSAAGAPQEVATEGNAPPSVYMAIQELGLRLESRTAPIRHLVVDHAEKIPTGN